MKTLQTNNPGHALAIYELEGYIEGHDVYNSWPLYNLTHNPNLTRENYTVGSNWYRPDLIAKEYYGDVRYESYVILQAGSIQNIVPGAVLSLVKPEDLRTITYAGWI